MDRKFKIIKVREPMLNSDEQNFILVDEKGEGELFTVFDDVEAGGEDWFCMLGEGPSGEAFKLIRDESPKDKQVYVVHDYETVSRVTITKTEVIIEALDEGVPEE